MAYVTKETNVSEAVAMAVNAYIEATKRRFRADALRSLVDIGLASDDQIGGYVEKGAVRLPLSVTHIQAEAVEVIRQGLPLDNGDKTYEVAYRLVIMRGLKASGHLK